MKIESVSIKNFRSFRDETVHFGDYTCLVGANGAGKSTVMHALNLFFREASDTPTDLTNLTEQDFHNGNFKEPIEIIVTFTGLSEKAKEDLKAYYRQDRVVIAAIATWDTDQRMAAIEQKGERLVMKRFAPFFEAEKQGALVPELRQVYDEIRKTVTDLPGPATKLTKGAMVETLRLYEEGHPDLCTQERSGDHFYGFTKGGNKLAPYVQWVYVPAVKDATHEQVEGRNTAFGRLLQRTVRGKIDYTARLDKLRQDAEAGYEKILAENQIDLNSLGKALDARLKELAHPEASLSLEWWNEQGKSVQINDPLARVVAGEFEFRGELGRLGHGFQRSFLLALLQELAGCDDPNGPRLILGCEEPELYQHPPQARHLSEVLRQLSTTNAQVMISTHSPLFIRGEHVEEIRMIRRKPGEKRSTITSATAKQIEDKIASAKGMPPRKVEGLLAKIHQTLQPAVNEMFFSPRLVLVEGLEDRAYLTTWLHIAGLWEEYRRGHLHIVAVDGKSKLIEAIAIADAFGIPTFVVFDSDGHEPKEDRRNWHKADNAAILALLGLPGIDPLPKDHYWGDRVVMWSSEIGEVVKAEVGPAEWMRCQTKADALHGQPGNLHKNALHVASSLTFAHEDKKFPQSLHKVCDKILTFANGTTPAAAK